MQNQGLGVYRRQEGFRLSFKEPIIATFTLLKIQGKDGQGKRGSVEILDLSLKGAKVNSSLRFPAPDTYISLNFLIAKEEFNIVGELIWRKERYNQFMYGVSFDPQSYAEEQLLDALKKYVKQNRS